MQNIDFNQVRGWQTGGGIQVPSGVSTVCPHCGEKGVFALSNLVDDPGRLTVAATGICPGCKKTAYFWCLRSKRKPHFETDNPSAIFMYPPVENYYPTPELSANVPAPLQKSLSSTIEAFNAKNYIATAVGGRRTLEGIFKYLVDEEKRNSSLAALIELVTKEKDLAAPLRTLSHAIRGGGNLGAHFDPENEPTEALARQMVELLDYLISYLYILPQKIQQLEQSLGKKR